MSIEAMKQALSEVKALATFIGRYDPPSIPNLFTKRLNALADHLSQAIAEAENQEPVAYDIRCDNCGGDGYDPKDNNYFCSSCEGAGFLEKLFYTAPQPKRELPNLTVDELIDLEQKHRSHESLSRAIEAKHKEKANEH